MPKSNVAKFGFTRWQMSKNLKKQNENFGANCANLKAQNIEARILFLAINEREKSLKFYESLLDSKDILDENLREIFGAIAQKEREILANARAVFGAIDLGESSVITADSHESNAIILPSALPENIWGELQNEMGAVDLKSLNILALGVESHHLKSCDFLIKKVQNLGNSRDLKAQNTKNFGANPKVLDMLYQLQALSYNHHIALLQGDSPKENANPNANPANPNPTNPPQITLQDLLNQNPLFSEIKTAFDSFQNFYAQTKIIVAKLERGDLSQDELVAFLQKLRF